MRKKNIGLDVEAPKEKCNDKNCPFHGDVVVRGRTFYGKVKKANMRRTVMIEWERPFYIPKYERYEKRRSRLKAHVPDCIKLNVGDKVRVVETRPISKTKNFVVVEVVK